MTRIAEDSGLPPSCLLSGCDSNFPEKRIKCRNGRTSDMRIGEMVRLSVVWRAKD